MSYQPIFRKGQGHGVANGGITAVTQYQFLPGFYLNVIPTLTGVFGAFDPSNSFDDPSDGGSYSFRVEEIIPMRYTTIRRVGIIYIDLGLATFTLQLSAVDDNQNVLYNTPDQTLATPFPTFTIGNNPSTGRVCQKFLDTTITGQVPQMVITRAPKSGPLAISKMWFADEAEETTY